MPRNFPAKVYIKPLSIRDIEVLEKEKYLMTEGKANEN